MRCTRHGSLCSNFHDPPVSSLSPSHPPPPSPPFHGLACALLTGSASEPPQERHTRHSEIQAIEAVSRKFLLGTTSSHLFRDTSGSGEVDESFCCAGKSRHVIYANQKHLLHSFVNAHELGCLSMLGWTAQPPPAPVCICVPLFASVLGSKSGFACLPRMPLVALQGSRQDALAAAAELGGAGHGHPRGVTLVGK